MWLELLAEIEGRLFGISKSQAIPKLLKKIRS